MKINIKPLTDHQAAESAMNELALVANNRRKLITKLDAEKLAAEAKYAANITACDEMIAIWEKALEGWATRHPEAFGKKKSLKFSSGTIGFRDGQPKLEKTSKAITWERCLEAVQALLPNFIRSMPEIDKEAIIAQRVELAPLLPQCGLKVIQGERFYAKPDLTDTEVKA
jgi:phage host-nuclease inhibitor protein Gam